MKKPKAAKKYVSVILSSYDSGNDISNMPHSVDGATDAGVVDNTDFANEESAASQEAANSNQAEETSARDGPPPAPKAKLQNFFRRTVLSAKKENMSVK